MLHILHDKADIARKANGKNGARQITSQLAMEVSQKEFLVRCRFNIQRQSAIATGSK
jgi:hypothetical protein